MFYKDQEKTITKMVNKNRSEKTNKMTKENNQVSLENTGRIELPKLDVKQYIGSEAVIEEVTEHEGQHGYFVKLTTGVIDTIGSEENPVELRASKILGLQTDDDGKVGWGDNTKMGSFLKAMKVSHYKDLVGKQVIVTMRRGKEGSEFLTFE